MNLWLVVTVAGQLAFSVGPINHMTYDQCEASAAKKRVELADTLGEGTASFVRNGQLIEGTDLNVFCLRQLARPGLPR